MDINHQNDKHRTLSSWRINIILIFTSYLAILVMVAGLVSYVYFSSSNNKVLIICILSITLAISLMLCIRYSMKKIYNPIVALDSATRIFESGDLESYLNYNINLRELSNSETILNILERLKNSINRQYSAEMLTRQAEFSALQSQINPHFLYNTLESIRGQALEQGVDEIAEMTEALSTFFRYSISKKGDLVTLDDEITNVENYFVIQQYRFDNKFSFSIQYDEEDIEVLNYMIPKLTIQPIVENSIYHGLETKIGKGRISIRITCTEKRLIINISDDGIGMDKTLLDMVNYTLRNYKNESSISKQQRKEYRHTGIALVNVNMRIKLLFGEQYGINLNSTKGFGTDVEIILPLVKNRKIDRLNNMGINYEN